MTCTWEADPACLGTKWDEVDEATKARCLALATSSLQMLTLYRVGTCPITIRPCPTERPCGCWSQRSYGSLSDNSAPFQPPLWDGRWFNCAGCGSRCEPLSQIDIPGPVHDIVLRIDGQVMDLDSGDWRLDNGHLLVWQGVGPSPIPSTQNLNLPDTEVGTWSITYSKSYPVSTDASQAVALLALEFVEACKPKGKCSLPRGVTNVVRAGVTFTVDAGLFVNGLTGIQIVDAFIMKWVPPGSPQRSATVFVPGQVQARRTSAVPSRKVSP